MNRLNLHRNVHLQGLPTLETRKSFEHYQRFRQRRVSHLFLCYIMDFGV